MFTDVFRGGPLDGEQRPSNDTTLTACRVIDEDSGAVYFHANQLDTDEARVWVWEDPNPSSPHTVRATSKEGLTLGELRRFVASADAQGWSDKETLRAVATWRLRLVKLELSTRPRSPRPT